MTAKINAKVGKKIYIFRQKFKISNCMPSSPCKPKELKVGMRGFYHQPNNLWSDGLILKKKVFFEQPYSTFFCGYGINYDYEAQSFTSAVARANEVRGH